MTRNEFIAQTASRLFAGAVCGTEIGLDDVENWVIYRAESLADALEAAGVAPWGEGEADAED